MAYARTAEGLVAEFPSWKIGYESLVGIARSSDPAEARRLVSKVKNSDHAPEEIKTAAIEVEERLSLVGRNLRALVRRGDADGLKSLSKKAPIVIYSWSAADALSMEKAVFLSRSASAGTAFVGICLDGSDTEGARQAANTAELPGLQLYDDASGSLADAFRFEAPGMGYVADKSGRIAAVYLSAEVMTDLGVLESL